MRVGLCYPTPGPDIYLDEPFLAMVREHLPVDLIRINLDYRNPPAGEMVLGIRNHGFEALPVLDLDYDELASWPQDDKGFGEAAWPYIERCVSIANLLELAEVEILNEPHVLHRLSPDRYAKLLNAVGHEFRVCGLPTRIIAAADMLKPHRRGPKKDDWWSKARAGLQSHLYDAVAVHPYRNPGHPDDAKPFGSRAKEFTWIREQAGGRPIYVTEVGWNLNETSGPAAAAYLTRELDLCAIQPGVEVVCIYAHVGVPGQQGGDWGLFDGGDWTPRPAVAAIRDWLERRTGQPPNGRMDAGGFVGGSRED